MTKTAFTRSFEGVVDSLEALDLYLTEGYGLSEEELAKSPKKLFEDLKNALKMDEELLVYLKNRDGLESTDSFSPEKMAYEVGRFLWTEIYLYVLELLNLDLPLEEATKAFVYKNEPLLAEQLHQASDLAKRLRRIIMIRHHKPTATPIVWEARIKEYLDFPTKLRFYGSRTEVRPLIRRKSVIDTFGEAETETILKDYQFLVSNRLSCDRFLNRLAIYERVLESYIVEENKPLHWLNPEKGTTLYSTYSSTKEGLSPAHVMTATSLDATALELLDEALLEPYVLPNYQPKVPLSIPEDFSIPKMLEYVGGKNHKLPMIRFKFADPTTNRLTFQGVIHILGALGVGKSNFKYGMTKFFLEDQGAKRIVIIEDKVSTVLSVVKKLRQELNLNALPLIGKNDERHLSAYLDTLSVKDYANDEVLDWISGECMVLSSQNDYQTEGRWAPCKKLKQEASGSSPSVVCPYISVCGRMKRYRDLNEATVWVTTVHSLLRGTVPEAFNRNKRTFFELVYDTADLVFFDEVDGTQDILDKGFLNADPLFIGNSWSSHLLELRSRMEAGLAGEKANRLFVALNALEEARTHFNALLANCPATRERAKGRTLTLKSLYYQILKSLDREAMSSEQFNKIQTEFKDLLNVANIHFYSKSREGDFQELLDKSSLYQSYRQLIDDYEKGSSKGRYREYTTFLSSIKTFFLEHGAMFNKSCKKNPDYLFELTAFLITLVDVDRFYKMLVTECDHIRLTNPTLFEGIQGLNMDGLPISNFTHEPLLDMRFGYLISQKENGSDYQLELYQYSGVGRKLLDSLAHSKEDLGMPGPAVVGLSGTSFFEDSLMYNFNVNPHLLLESVNDDGTVRGEGRMTSFYIPTVSTDNKNNPAQSVSKIPYVSVSGSGATLAERCEAYRQILTSLSGFNDTKTNYLEIATQEKPTLMVTGNYDEAKYVHNWLCSKGYRSVGLVQEKKNGDFTITRSEVEDLAQSDYKDRQFLVVSLASINRGYNILDANYNSHFGAVFFLARPYPQPLSFEGSLKKTHARYDEAVQEIQSNDQLTLLEKLTELYFKNMDDFESFYNMGYWDQLEDYEKAWVSADALVPIKQMIGRTQRNQNKTLVFFCDGAFSPRKNKDLIGTANGDSMIDCWLRSLEKMIENHPFGTPLFGEFYRSLQEMVEVYAKSTDY